MSRRFLSAVSTAVAGAALLAACGGAANGAAHRSQTDPFSDRTERMPLVLRVRGALTISMNEKGAPVRVLRVGGEGLETVRLLSVGLAADAVPHDIVTLPGGAQLRLGFDLAGFDGNGSYKIQPKPAGYATSAPQNASALSGVNLMYFPSGYTGPVERFIRLRQPCDVSVGKDGRAGVLRCANVGSDAGRVVSIEMRWG